MSPAATRIGLLALAWLWLAAGGSDAPTGPLWTSLPAGAEPAQPRMTSFADLIEQAGPAVVAIHTTGLRPDALQDSTPESDPVRPWWPLPGPPPPGDASGIGTGFVVRADGLVVTNRHVIHGAQTIWVQLAQSRQRLTARVLGSDPRSDLALLQVDAPDPLPVLPLGDSDRLRTGQWVVAIGNPLGMTHLATKGIVSGQGRSLGDLVTSRSGFVDFIQTDAAIDRGNSGGPLLNLRGEVIGINTAINSRARGIGFAVPINLAKAVLPHLARRGRLVRSYLGITVDDLTWELARSLGLDRARGVVITELRPDTPAQRAGLRKADVILRLDSVELTGRADLAWRAGTRPAGEPVRLSIWRASRELEIEVLPVERDQDESAAPAAVPGRGPPPGRLGLKVVDLSAELAQAAGLGEGVRGVVVVLAEGQAGEAGLRLGDVICEVNGLAVATLAELEGRVASIPPGEMVRFYVLRQRGALFVALKKNWRE